MVTTEIEAAIAAVQQADANLRDARQLRRAAHDALVAADGTHTAAVAAVVDAEIALKDKRQALISLVRA